MPHVMGITFCLNSSVKEYLVRNTIHEAPHYAFSPVSWLYLLLLLLKSVVFVKVTCGSYTGCPRSNVPNFGRVFLMLNYTDITQNTYIQS